MKIYAALVTFVIVAAMGCNSDSKNGAPAGDVKTESSAQTSSAATSVPDAKQPSTVDTAKPPAVPKDSVPPLSSGSTSTPNGSVPASLKHEGYEYEGFDDPKPIDMEMVTEGSPGVITGSQSYTFKDVKDGTATFSVDRTGGLTDLGSQDATVDKDGVYIKSSSIVKMSPKAMDLPASPKPGMSWNFRESVNQKDKQMDLEITSKIIGYEDVTTKGGSYKHALYVEQTGVGTIRKEKARTVIKNWYVKGIGTVKADQKVIFSDGKTASLTIQETHH